MTDYQYESEQAATRGLLQAVSEELGHDLAPEWAAAALAAPRHHFLPERIWLDDGAGGYAPCGREQDPARWFAAAYANEAVVTQVNDGQEPDGQVWPSSSLSAPAIVFRMLEALDLDALGPDDAVYEIGTGRGWSAALLCHRLGDHRVVTAEIDASSAEQARANLAAAGFLPEIVISDGAEGWNARGPYTRTVATCAVRRVPQPWVEQTRPGGIILTPWDNPWICWGLLTLAVSESGAAVGRFSSDSAFMLMRTQRASLSISDVVKEGHKPDESTTTLPRRTVVWGNAAFAVGMRLGDVGNTWQDAPVEGVKDRLWLVTIDGTSWAAVDHDGGDQDEFTVHQYGPRRLWDEVEAAYFWWVENGKPGPERFGLTVTPDGEHRAWLDEPVLSWLLRDASGAMTEAPEAGALP
ncbi:methyltransferase domain-containing protein [Kitasatospora azatica]|uniref:methyltransferase n=1 Tax=Kitasatospora azatica TaxID=58347 RepID=UPI000690F393|nr:methyltransferase [Kitasatospora azatica]